MSLGKEERISSAQSDYKKLQKGIGDPDRLAEKLTSYLTEADTDHYLGNQDEWELRPEVMRSQIKTMRVDAHLQQGKEALARIKAGDADITADYQLLRRSIDATTDAPRSLDQERLFTTLNKEATKLAVEHYSLLTNTELPSARAMKEGYRALLAAETLNPPRERDR